MSYLDLQLNFELNILDDGSSDDTPLFCRDFVTESKIPTKYIRLEEGGYNLPFMRNIGAESSRGSHVVYVDNDIVVDRNFIRDYMEHFDKDGKVIYLGKLLYVKTNDSKNITISNIQNGRFEKLRKGLNSEVDPRKGTLKEIKLYQKFWGGNFGMERKLFLSLGGFDEDFKDWGGLDSDFGLRLCRAGYELRLLDDCLGYHLGDEFKPLSEIIQSPGVRMFNEIKKYEKEIVRNGLVEKVLREK